MAIFISFMWWSCARCLERPPPTLPSSYTYKGGGDADRNAWAYKSGGGGDTHAWSPYKGGGGGGGGGDTDRNAWRTADYDARQVHPASPADRDARQGGSPARPFAPLVDERDAAMPPSPPFPVGAATSSDDWMLPPRASHLLEWFGLRQHRDGGSDRLRTALRGLGSARQLWLTDVDDEAAFSIAESLTPGHARALEMVRLGGTMGPDGAAALFDALGRGGAPRLQALHLSGTRLGDEGASALAYDLLRGGGCSRLRELQLDHCTIGDAGAAALGEALRDGAAPSLQNLWLGGNRIGDYGAEALAMAVTPGGGRALGLRRLALHSNAISDVGALAVARAVEARNRERPRVALGPDGPLATLTIMLWGHRAADDATVQMVAEVDALGARTGGDRIELYAANTPYDGVLSPSLTPSSPSRHSASPATMQSPVRALPTWSSPGGAYYEYTSGGKYSADQGLL